MQSSGWSSMLPHHRAGHDGSPAACYVNDAGRACVSLVHVSLESCCAPTDPIFFSRFTPLHMQHASLLYFRHFLFPALYSAIGEFAKRRDDLQSSAPASTSTLLRPPGAPPLPTHTSARLYIYSPSPPPAFPPAHTCDLLSARDT